MRIETKTLIGLTLLAILDMVIPLPILGVILVVVVLQKPPWFIRMAREIYADQQ